MSTPPAFTFFDPNDAACREILLDPRTTVPQLFAILRQWVPQVQHSVDVIGNEVGGSGSGCWRGGLGGPGVMVGSGCWGSRGGRGKAMRCHGECGGVTRSTGRGTGEDWEPEGGYWEVTGSTGRGTGSSREDTRK